MIAALLVGVLTFAAGDPGLPYSIMPTLAERRALGERLAHDLRADHAPARYFNTSCTDDACARRFGRQHHLSAVIMSSATRHMAMIWTAQSQIVVVSNGRVRGPYDIGYKGDYDAITAGLDTLAGALAPALR